MDTGDSSTGSAGSGAASDASPSTMTVKCSPDYLGTTVVGEWSTCEPLSPVVHVATVRSSVGVPPSTGQLPGR